MEDLKQLVVVTGIGTAMWDGVSYDLSQTVKVRLGVARHWEGNGHQITIQYSSEASIPPRDIVNPLADETQGEAFQGLRRGRKPKEG